MGIWGNLNEIRLPDLLLLLEERDGVLVIQCKKRLPLSLEISGGRLGTVREGKRPIPLYRAEERLLTLMREQDAAFNFRPDDLLPTASGPKLSALALRLSTLFEEIEAVRRRLPAPSARFLLKDPRPLPQTRWRDIFEKAKDPLSRGVSALELSDFLRIPLPVAQHFLYEASRARRVIPEQARRMREPGLGRLLARFVATP